MLLLRRWLESITKADEFGIALSDRTPDSVDRWCGMRGRKEAGADFAGQGDGCAASQVGHGHMHLAAIDRGDPDPGMILLVVADLGAGGDEWISHYGTCSTDAPAVSADVIQHSVGTRPAVARSMRWAISSDGRSAPEHNREIVAFEVCTRAAKSDCFSPVSSR